MPAVLSPTRRQLADLALVPETVDDATRREVLIGGTAMALLGLAGCGDDDDRSTTIRRAG